jgi:DnaJ-class molecular chaperone
MVQPCGIMAFEKIVRQFVILSARTGLSGQRRIWGGVPLTHTSPFAPPPDPSSFQGRTQGDRPALAVSNYSVHDHNPAGWALEAEGGPMAAKTIACAFCDGAGKDPFGLLSGLSLCQVCGGRSSVAVSEPAVACAYCGGGGRQRHQRLTCTSCGGRGMITIQEPAETCPHCQGTGAAPLDQEFLPCAPCRGAGVITVKEKVQQPA